MSMMLRRGMMVPKVVPGGLPSEYLQVQYLESTGTQYLELLPDGYSVSTYVAGYLDLVITEKQSGTEYGLFGGKPNGSTPAPVLSLPSSSTKFSLWCNAATMWNSSYDATVGTRYTVDAYWYLNNSRKITVNGSTETVSNKNNSAISTNPESMKLCLFKDGRRAVSAGSTYFAKMRIYSAKIDVDGNIIRDMIPCIRIADSKPGMYDLVGRQFYTNAGTGEFLFSMGENFCEPLSGTWFEREQNGTITYTSGTGTVISATGTTGWSLYMFSGNNSKTFAQLEGKKLYLEYEVDDITIDNSSSITFGICAFRKVTPADGTDRKAYTTGADYASILMPRTDGTYKGIFTVDTDTIIPHSDSFSKNNFIGTCVYLNGYNGDTLTIKRLELHEILEP